MTTEQQKKRKKRFIVLGVAAAVIIFGCVACLLISPVMPAVTVAPTATYDWPEPEGPPIPEDWTPRAPTVRPTKTPCPTFTPQPTAIPTLTPTPRPTRTPQPTAIPTPLPEVKVLTGSGDAVLDVHFEIGALLHVVGNSAGRHFAVKNYDENNEQISLLVNTTDPYDGFRPIDMLAGEDTERILITATGEWSVSIIPIAPIPEWKEHYLYVPGTYEGRGDNVILLGGGQPDIAIIKGNAEGRYFGVFGADALRRRLLVNTTDPYEGSKLLESDTWLLEVKATGPWTIEVTER